MTTETSQVSRDELGAMTPDQVFDAYTAGRLNTLLGRPVVEGSDGGGDGSALPQFTLDDVRSMTPDQVYDAYTAGRLRQVMGGSPC